MGAPGALARGDAAVNLRFPHAGYREKIWDHAAGALIVAEAGAAITDAAGALPRSVVWLRCGVAQCSDCVCAYKSQGCLASNAYRACTETRDSPLDVHS